MSRLTVSELVTLDGISKDPGGAEGFQHGGWAFEFERGTEGERANRRDADLRVRAEVR